MKNFRQHMSNIHPCLLEYFEYLEGRIDLAQAGGSKTTIVLTDDKFIEEDYDIIIDSTFRAIATGKAQSESDIENTITDEDLELIKNAYFLVFRADNSAVIYYNNNKMWRNTTEIKYECMNSEVGRRVLVNPATKIMKLQRT